MPKGIPNGSKGGIYSEHSFQNRPNLPTPFSPRDVIIEHCAFLALPVDDECRTAACGGMKSKLAQVVYMDSYIIDLATDAILAQTGCQCDSPAAAGKLAIDKRCFHRRCKDSGWDIVEIRDNATEVIEAHNAVLAEGSHASR